MKELLGENICTNLSDFGLSIVSYIYQKHKQNNVYISNLIYFKICALKNNIKNRMGEKLISDKGQASLKHRLTWKSTPRP